MPDYQQQNNELTITFNGSLDTTTCIAFEEELYDQIKEVNSKVVFDIQNVSNISSMFLRICTKTAKIIGKENISIINANENTMKVFTLTKLDSFLAISTQ